MKVEDINKGITEWAKIVNDNIRKDGSKNESKRNNSSRN